MEIYLIRHTQVHNPDKLCYGQSDIELAENWKNDIQNVCSKLPFDDHTAVLSSPFKRCTDLADVISCSNFIQKHELSEMNFGDWELKPWNDINLDTLNAWMADFVNFQVPGGENFKTMHRRCSDFWDELLEADHQKLFIITHAGVIRSILAHVLSIPLDKIFQLQIHYGSISKVLFNKEFKNQTVDYINRF